MGENFMLNITKTSENSTVKFTLEGRLDTTTAPKLETEILSAIDGTTLLILDFEKLEYISSAGLRVLLLTQKKMNVQGKMKLVHVKESVMEILEITGFTDILTIE